MEQLVVLSNNIDEVNKLAFRLGVNSNDLKMIDTVDKAKGLAKNCNSLLLVALTRWNDYDDCYMTLKGSAYHFIYLGNERQCEEFVKRIADSIELTNDMFRFSSLKEATQNGINRLQTVLNTIGINSSNGFSISIGRLPDGNFFLRGTNEMSRALVKLIIGYRNKAR